MSWVTWLPKSRMSRRSGCSMVAYSMVGVRKEGLLFFKKKNIVLPGDATLHPRLKGPGDGGRAHGVKCYQGGPRRRMPPALRPGVGTVGPHAAAAECLCHGRSRRCLLPRLSSRPMRSICRARSSSSSILPSARPTVASRAWIRAPEATRRSTPPSTAACVPGGGGELWLNAEVDQGFGISDTLGLAAYSNAEGAKVGEASPYPRIPRLFFRQTLDLGGASEPVAGDVNTLAQPGTHDRVVLTIGKFQVVDVFDTNAYAHDSKHDFLNWAMVDAGAFDYAAECVGLFLRCVSGVV